MKKNNGFTLIELLATIIILAVIALVAFPSILNVIKNSEQQIDETTKQLAINSAKLYIDENLNDYPIISGNTYCITLKTLIKDGDLSEGMVNAKDENTSENKTVKVSVTDDYNYEVVNNNQCEEYWKVFENGEVVYFDVSTGSKCNNYHEDNSKTGYNGISSTKNTNNQNGCLKFYAFNDSKTSTVAKLILDHNTTAQAFWNSDSNTNNGPITALDTLKKDTKEWKGTEEPQPYVDLVKGYPISYYGYKARLLDANEVPLITGHSNWNSNDYGTGYYLDTNTVERLPGCQNGDGDVSGCQYGWLYDRTLLEGTKFGSLNNADVSTDGYWTSSAYYGKCVYSYEKDYLCAWIIDHNADIDISAINRSDNGNGIRPVIEVLKSKL